MTHPYPGECEIRLYAPDGSYVILSEWRGGHNENVFYGTLFTDLALNLVSSYVFSNNIVASPLKPEEPFSKFIDKNPNGQWKLWINNNDEHIYPGKLDGFILNIQGNFLFSLFFFLKKKILKRWMFKWKSMRKWDLCFNRNNNF